MLSLAMRQKQRQADAIQMAERVPYSPETAFATLANAKQLCQLQLRGLRVDLGELKKLQGYQAKADYKRQLIPKYQDYIQRYLASGWEHPNEVLVYVVIWLFDTNQLFDALELATIAIQQQQPMPETFRRREMATFVCDEVLKALDHRIEDSETIFDWVLEYLLNGTWDVIKEVKARFYKIAASKFEANNQLDDALVFYEKAHETWEKVQVKTKLEKLRNKLTK
ncbi:phage terminase small subunit [Zooshikella ganghwensis]|uniref:phage terminase small subunit n=1 Tax=Zooshikella ganghwensis TaxID=202772 RepID=UPI00040D2CA8|nr:phage terminase small subunit [Zooshikella ganghwensis]